MDLRELPTFTIDPAEARDFDDAISAVVENGFTRVWVHIADVTAYVRPGGQLEREAFRRATSVYVPGAVEPMLPEVLSSRECSLRPGEDRLAVTVEMEIEGRGPPGQLHRSRVRSDARLTYGQVDDVFAGCERAADPWARPGGRACGRGGPGRAPPRARGRRRGAELLVRLRRPRDRGRLRGADGVAPPDRAAHGSGQRAGGRIPGRRAAAHALPRSRAPRAAIGGVHDRAARLARRPHAARPGEHEPAAGGRPRDGDVALGARPLRPPLADPALAQAGLYSPRNLGHAGLGSARYCHFTSPIRRYPDVVAHRALLQGLGIDHAAAPAHELDEAGIHSSAVEREAMQVERDADDVCLAFLLERNRPEGPLEGEVVGLIEKGVFVRFGEEGYGLPSGAAAPRLVDPERAAPRWWRRSRAGACASGTRST